MIKLIYAPVFVKQLKKLELALQDDVLEKIELFKDKKNHKILKVHKLHGKFTDCFSFYVNYNTRIVFYKRLVYNTHITMEETLVQIRLHWGLFLFIFFLKIYDNGRLRK